MAYQFDTYDNSVVLNGEENGIADSPYAGIANIVNANITSIPGEVSVGFSTKNMTAPSRITGNITSVSTSTGLFQFNNSQLFLENGMAIYFDSISGISGITTSIPYWIFGITNNNGSGSFYLTSSYSLASPGAVIPTTTGIASFLSDNYDMETPNFIVRVENPSLSSYKTVFILDTDGRLFSNIYTTYPSGYYTFTGNTLTTDGFSDNGNNGMCIYKNYLFVFHKRYIDYYDLNSFTPNYRWDPVSGTVGSVYYSNRLNSVYPHYAIANIDETVYICNGTDILSFYQTYPQTPFNPLTTSTYTYQDWPLLPSSDYATCLTQLGTNLLIGGSRNVIYPWDRYDTQYTSPIFLPENFTNRIVTAGSNAYAFSGFRGNIYITNGSQSSFWQKIPDHLSGTIEPYVKWGDAVVHKNKIYFGFSSINNNLQDSYSYSDGLWQIDINSQSLILSNILSIGQSGGRFISAIYAPLDMENGYGLIIGDSIGKVEKTVSTPYVNASTIIEYDLIPIGTYLEPRNLENIEFKLSQPMSAGESISLYSRTSFNSSYSLIKTFTGIISGKSIVNFKKAQWLQIKVVLNSTIIDSPSYVRLSQIRITGLTGKTLGTQQILTD